MVVDRDDDDGRLRRPGSSHLPRDAGRVGVRSGGRSYAQLTRPDHRQQLWPVLLAHTGASQATEGPTTRGGTHQRLIVSDANRHQ